LTFDGDPQYIIGEGQLNFSVLKPNQDFDAGEFIPNNRPYYNLGEPWKEEEEDGFDIYIDALHNLPDNCSLVKIRAKVINNKGVEQCKMQEYFPKMDISSFQKQIYNEKLELRDITTDPTSMLQLSFHTIDTTLLKPKMIGYSFFPIFMDIETKMPIYQADKRIVVKNLKRTLHKGSY